ncbi:MAG: hypothetical protein ABEJ03_01095 [Candidatus Nanohaloarchaea archaeon]
MTELLHDFETGPYELLEFSTVFDGQKAVIEINEGDLGRLPIESLETVEKLREALEQVELELKERERRNEEL